MADTLKREHLLIWQSHEPRSFRSLVEFEGVELLGAHDHRVCDISSGARFVDTRGIRLHSQKAQAIYAARGSDEQLFSVASHESNATHKAAVRWPKLVERLVDLVQVVKEDTPVAHDHEQPFVGLDRLHLKNAVVA
jgi:hypothetical protein